MNYSYYMPSTIQQQRPTFFPLKRDTETRPKLTTNAHARDRDIDLNPGRGTNHLLNIYACLLRCAQAQGFLDDDDDAGQALARCDKLLYAFRRVNKGPPDSSPCMSSMFLPANQRDDKSAS